MPDPTAGRSGWLVSDPEYLKDVPTKRSDLFRQVQNVQGVFVPKRMFETEVGAEHCSTDLLIDLKQKADAQVKHYSEPSKDVKERDRIAFLDEAKKLQRIADAGLAILNVSAETIEELSGFRPAGG